MNNDWANKYYEKYDKMYDVENAIWNDAIEKCVKEIDTSDIRLIDAIRKLKK